MLKVENGLYKIIREIFSIAIVIVFVFLFKKFIVSPIRVNGESMFPTLEDGDIMILDVIGYHINGLKRFDIVVVDQGNELIIKRVIGLPGETVEYREGRLYIDGKEYTSYDNYAIDTADYSKKIPEGEYFVLGDNRTNSVDSRVFGSFSGDYILGKASLVIFPFSRFGSKS